MKKREFVKLSQANLPLDELKLEENEMLAVKGGLMKDPSSGTNCNCECSGGTPGSGENCNCSCGGGGELEC